MSAICGTLSYQQRADLDNRWHNTYQQQSLRTGSRVMSKVIWTTENARIIDHKRTTDLVMIKTIPEGLTRFCSKTTLSPILVQEYLAERKAEGGEQI